MVFAQSETSEGVTEKEISGCSFFVYCIPCWFPDIDWRSTTSFHFTFLRRKSAEKDRHACQLASYFNVVPLISLLFCKQFLNYTGPKRKMGESNWKWSEKFYSFSLSVWLRFFIEFHIFQSSIGLSKFRCFE